MSVLVLGDFDRSDKKIITAFNGLWAVCVLFMYTEFSKTRLEIIINICP